MLTCYYCDGQIDHDGVCHGCGRAYGHQGDGEDD